MTDTHIKIKPVVPKVQYTGNGSTTVFPYTFAIFADSDMVVYVDDEIIETGYTVSGAGQTDGGNVTFDTAPADGKKITLLRQVPVERVTDFQEGGTFRPKNINDELDRQTAFIQQTQEEMSRCVKVDVTSDVSPSTVLEQVERIYSSIDNVDTVADDISNVNSVASNSTNINSVASNITNINAVAGNATNINAVAGNSTNINAVNANKTNIDAVATNITNVNTVATNSTNINTVASNMTSIGTVVSNITDIQNASTNASNAASSATLSESWATSTTVVEDDKYGALYYSTQAATSATNAASSASLAQQWATKTSGAVSGTDYSAKYNALLAQDWATKMDGPVSGSDYSAKYNANLAQQAAASINVSIAGASDTSLSNLQNGQILVYNNVTEKWENQTPQLGLTSTTVTLTAADWSTNTQTVSVTGMTASKIVWVSPDASSASDYASADILCTAQGSGTLTFTCSDTPSTDITVVIVFG